MEIKYECPICHQKFESRLNRDLYARYCASRDLFLDTSDTLLEFLKTNKSEIPVEEQHKVMDRINAIDSQYDEDDDCIEEDDEDDEEIDGEEVANVLSDILELLGAILHDKNADSGADDGNV